MKTRKPITTISYNTDNFLVTKLEQLRKAKIISLWFFVNHLAEDDEKSNHKHLYILPAKMIQTDDLVEELLEFDSKNPSKPLKCLLFRSCNSFADWYLYSIHDKSYLLSKGQKRKYTYTIEDFICSDSDELSLLVREIDMTDYSAFSRLQNAISQGITFQEFLKRGCVPIQQINQYVRVWELLTQTDVSVYRDKYSGHS